jgi:hypothetical protein
LSFETGTPNLPAIVGVVGDENINNFVYLIMSWKFAPAGHIAQSNQ